MPLPFWGSCAVAVAALCALGREHVRGGPHRRHPPLQQGMLTYIMITRKKDLQLVFSITTDEFCDE
jgi:hypothetical protein